MDAIELARLRQLNQQQQAGRQAQPLTYRIGPRDPVTGKYQLIYPDGSVATGAEKLYSAASEPGDRVLAQQRRDRTWLLREASPSRRRRSGGFNPMPGREKKKSAVWVLYEYQGGLWVGGHSAAPERIADASLIGYGPNYPAYGNRRACIWGDKYGWKMSFREIGNDLGGGQPFEFNKKIGVITSEGSDNRLRIRDDSNTSYPTGLNGYQNVLGGGYWELQGNVTAFDYRISTEIRGQTEQDTTFSHGYWDGTVITQRSTTVKLVKVDDFIDRISTNSVKGVGSMPLFLGLEGAIFRDHYYDNSSNGTTSFQRDQLDITRLWFRDRSSSLFVRFAGTAAFQFGMRGTLTLHRATASGVDLLSSQTLAPTVFSNSHLYGVGLDIYINNLIKSGNRAWSDDHFSVAPIPNGFYESASPPSEVWYTGGQVIKVLRSEIEKLKIATLNVNISEIAIDGTETITSVLGFAIPPTANILSYCGSKS
jgi:hypothetical protein